MGKLKYLPAAFIIASVIAGCGDQNANQNQVGENNTPVVIAPAAGPTFQLTSPERILAGGCAKFKIVANQPVAQELLFAAEDLSIAMYRDSACRLAIGSVPMPSGSTSADFYVSTKRSGAFSLKLRWDVNKEPLNAAGTVLPSTSLKVNITGKSNAVAGECFPVVLRSLDIHDNVVVSNATFTLSNGFYKDSACANAQNVPLPFGNRATYGLYSKRNSAGVQTLQAQAPGVADGMLSTTIVAAPIKNVWTYFPRIALNACGAALVRVGDQFGNETNSPSDLQIQVSPVAGSRFFLTSDCSDTAKTAPFNVAIDQGRSRVLLYIKGTVAGALEIPARVVSASPSLTLSPHTGRFVVDVALLARTLAYSPADTTMTVRRAACTRLTVQLLDNVSLPTRTLANYAPMLSGSDDKARFFSNSSCTTAITRASMVSGTSSATFYYKDVSSAAGDHVSDVTVADPQNIYTAARIRITSQN